MAEDKRDKFANTGWCIVCHTPLTQSNACYCPKCRAIYAKLDDEKIRKYADGDTQESIGFVLMSAKVVEEFMKEYSHNLDLLMANPFSRRLQDEVRLNEKRIYSDDFAMLTLDKADPNKVIKAMRKNCVQRAKDKQKAYIEEEVERRLKEKGESK